jgi:hypothetical protein
MGAPEPHPAAHLRPHLEADETIEVVTRATDAILAVTDRRLLVATGRRLALAVPFRDLRRIQFDIERTRPATLVIVPEHPGDEPQVLAIPHDEYPAAAQALAILGRRLND